MEAAIPYPLDYQLSLGRTIRIRLEASRAAGRAQETRKLEETLARLRNRDFGTCLACGGLIPFLEMAQDPSRLICLSCLGQETRRCSSTS